MLTNSVLIQQAAESSTKVSWHTGRIIVVTVTCFSHIKIHSHVRTKFKLGFCGTYLYREKTSLAHLLFMLYDQMQNLILMHFNFSDKAGGNST